MNSPSRRTGFALFVLFGINFMNFYDRQVVGAIGERLKNDWLLSDGQLGGLTTAFILLYSVVGIPLGRLADRGRRSVILGTGAMVWSAFTALSGLASGFASLFIFRMGVGVGEASCAPAANSLLGDLFPQHQRARAISIFMLGLPLGLGASYAVSGLIMQATGGWRGALFVAAVPGVILGLLAFLIPEPVRGSADGHATSAAAPDPHAIRAILRIRTMWWIILSGALLNLNMYAMGGFLTSFMIRYHGLEIGDANLFISVVYGFGGGLGMLTGGWLGDRASRNRMDGRLRAAAVALMMAAPLVVIALQQARGSYWNFALLMLPGCFLHYIYYSTVYASIQDVVEPARRGTAMAVYFMAFYFATAIGLYAFGKLSDHLAGSAVAAGASLAEGRALGLHGAMYVIPIVATLVGLVLWAGSRTIAADHARMQDRLRAV
jgi:MFS family permease